MLFLADANVGVNKMAGLDEAVSFNEVVGFNEAVTALSFF